MRFSFFTSKIFKYLNRSRMYKNVISPQSYLLCSVAQLKADMIMFMHWYQHFLVGESKMIFLSFINQNYSSKMIRILKRLTLCNFTQYERIRGRFFFSERGCALSRMWNPWCIMTCTCVKTHTKAHMYVQKYIYTHKLNTNLNKHIKHI